MIFTIIITQFYFYRVTSFNTGPLYLVLKCLIFCAHAINYSIFKRHQWLIQNLTMKTSSFLDPVTSKFLLLLIQSVSYLDAFGKKKTFMPCPGYFPFSIADFFLRYWICTYTGVTNLKQSECVLSLNLLIVSTFYISSLAGTSCIKMLLSPGKLG